MSNTTFHGKIRVASRIIDFLSSGLYHSPAACLKELINNSYDADATKVEVYIKPDADRIIIDDNGCGMSKEDFTSHFERISESHKRLSSDQTERGRPKIGKIGIGFIAANEICEVMEIYSTKAGSTELLHVRINFDEMRKSPEERRDNQTDFVKADYEGEILQANQEEHYTSLFLTSVRGAARETMAGANLLNRDTKAKSLYGLREESIIKELKSLTLHTWKDFDLYSQTMLQVALNVPVAYYSEWLPTQFQPFAADMVEEAASLDFHVYYDGTEIKKPIVFAPQSESAFLSRFEFEGEHVSARGYFYVQHGTIKPQDLQGLLVRIRNAAVGEYDHSFWSFSPSESSIIQRWVSAEIWADDRLEEAMNIDRRTLRDTSPPYVELRDAIHKHLKTVLGRARTEIYEAGNTERKTKRLSETKEAVASLASKTVAPVAPDVARQLEKSIQAIDVVPATRKAFEKKYAVTEIYGVLIDIAKDILTEEQLAKLLQRLTERIGK
jgi:hypothetical protein